MTAFLASPVWATVIGVVGTAVVGMFGMIWRMSSRVDRISDTVQAIATDVTEIKADPNVVRWSDIAPMRFRRRYRGF
jgi:hypothetical protein